MTQWQILLVILSGSLVQSQQELVTTEKPNAKPSDYPYCFRFTWLGEKFDKDSEIKNLTCETFRQDLKNVPCRRPLVATKHRLAMCLCSPADCPHFEGNLPINGVIWRNHEIKPVKWLAVLFAFVGGPTKTHDGNSNSKEPNTLLMWEKFHKKPLEIGCRLVRGESCIKYSYMYNHAVENITYMCAKVNASNGCYTQKYAIGREVEVCVCESSAGAAPCFTSTADTTMHQSIATVVYTMIFTITFLSLRM